MLFLRRGRGCDRLVMLKDLEVVLVLEHRPAPPEDGGDDREEHDGDEAAGKAVVVEVHPRHGDARMEHHRRVEEPGQEAHRPPEIAGDGGQRSTEEARKLEGRGVDLPAHHQSAQQHTRHDGQDVPRVLAEGGEPHDGKDAPQRGAVQVPSGEQDIGRGDEAVDPGVDEHRRGYSLY